MQAQLLEFKELLSVWYLVALENKIFVAALVVAVWVCFSILYSLRSYVFKKKIKISERKSNELKEQLNSAEQTIKNNELALATAAQQMEEEQQATVDFNKKVAERQQLVVEKIRDVATNFDLSEQLVGSSDSISNEVIWQQQDNMISQLTEKLTAEKNVSSALQAAHKDELNRITASDSSAELVKEGLEALTKQLSKLETSAAEQSKQQEVLKNELQEQLVDALEKNKTELVELISKLDVQESINLESEEPAIVEEVTPVAPEPEVLEVVQETIIESEPEPAPAPVALEVPAAEIAEPVVNKIDIPAAPTVEKIAENVTPAPSVAAIEVADEIQAAPALKAEKPKAVKKPVKKKKTKNIMGFTKSLFSTKGMKKMPKQVVGKTEAVAHARERDEPVKLTNSDYSSGINFKSPFKGLLRKKKK
ncbi:MAG: hypothetical protein PSN04_08420 [Methyloprofundus sp.]|nr:hypothetical protein [Methyloprofundus sp.]